jgi:hypothetical protein
MNRNTITKIILLLVFFLVFTKTTENFWSRPNKCLDCEKDIKSMNDAHLAFPSKCFSCEKQSKNPYFEGPSKCFNCDVQINKGSCSPVDDTNKYQFETYMRNRFPNRS